MFIPKDNVTDLRSGDRIVYNNGAKRFLSEVKILKEKNVYEGNENYDSKIDHTSSCFGFYYKIQNGKVVLADSAIGIERKDLGTGTENKK